LTINVNVRTTVVGFHVIPRKIINTDATSDAGQ